MIAVAHGAGKQLVLKPAFTERDEHVNRAIKQHFLHLWLQIEVVTSVQLTLLSNLGLSNGGFGQIQIQNR